LRSNFQSLPRAGVRRSRRALTRVSSSLPSKRGTTGLELDSLAGTRHPVFASSASQSSITLHAVESDGEPSGENIENSTSDAGSGQTSHDLHPGEKRLILWVAAVSAFAAIAGAGVGGYATYRTATLQTTSASNQKTSPAAWLLTPTTLPR
jgi:hypothetical protein